MSRTAPAPAPTPTSALGKFLNNISKFNPFGKAKTQVPLTERDVVVLSALSPLIAVGLVAYGTAIAAAGAITTIFSACAGNKEDRADSIKVLRTGLVAVSAGFLAMPAGIAGLGRAAYLKYKGTDFSRNVYTPSAINPTLDNAATVSQQQSATTPVVVTPTAATQNTTQNSTAATSTVINVQPAGGGQTKFFATVSISG